MAAALCAVSCGGGSSDPPQPTFSVGGTTTGLVGTGLVLQDNGGDGLSVSSDGSFTFATRLTANQSYSVTVKNQPSNPGQACTVTGGSGSVASSDVTTVAVSCPPPGPSITGNGFAPPTGLGDTDAYAPLASGNLWSFNVTTTDKAARASAWIMAATIAGTQSTHGVNATVLRQADVSGRTPTIDSYYYVSAGGVTYLGNNDATDPITPALVPYATLLFPVQLGTVSALTGARVPAGQDSSGNPLTIDLTQQVVNSAFESVSVPAGTFPNALRQVMTRSGTVHDAALNQSTSVSETDTVWLVPGVGIVKETTATSSASTTLNRAEDLRGYTVNGTRRGLGLPFTVAGNLSPVNGDPNPPVGHPAVGSDGTNFLVVTRAATGNSPYYTVKWVGTLVAPDGSVLKSFDLNAAAILPTPTDATDAVVAFDGTNYLVVYEQDDSSSATGQPESLVAVRVSTSGTVLGSGATIALGCRADGCAPPALAFDGSRYLLVYPQASNGLTQIEGVFISPTDGQASGTAFAVSPAPGYPGQFALAFGGGVYLLAWDQQSWTGQSPGLYAARIQTDGTVLDAAGIPIAAPSSCCGNPALAFDGHNFMLAFSDNRLDNVHVTVSATRITPAGAVLDPSAIAVTSSQNDFNGLLQLAFIGGEYSVAWVGSTVASPAVGLWGQRLSTSGAVLFPDSAGMALAPTANAPTIAMQGGAQGGILVWLDKWAPLLGNDVGGVMLYPAGP
ncbi:MAG TPA: hypothetical protein VKB72_08725 [Steroidobacteraceae bacterium]|nr:hypothetical protein [Steroidobacteraceae bacterium]